MRFSSRALFVIVLALACAADLRAQGGTGGIPSRQAPPVATKLPAGVTPAGGASPNQSVPPIPPAAVKRNFGQPTAGPPTGT